MNKTFKKFSAIAAICMVSLGAFAQMGTSLPFIGQGDNTIGGQIPTDISGYLQFNASSTNSYGSTNVWVMRGYNWYSGLNYTNPYSGVVYNTNSIVPVFVTNTAAIGDVDLWANRDGTTPVANISATIAGQTSAFTNTVTLNFALINGGGYVVTTGTGSGLTFSMTGNGTNIVTVQTNLLVSATVQGARRIRLNNLASTNAGTNGWLVNCWVNGYKPNAQ